MYNVMLYYIILYYITLYYIILCITLYYMILLCVCVSVAVSAATAKAGGAAVCLRRIRALHILTALRFSLFNSYMFNSSKHVKRNLKTAKAPRRDRAALGSVGTGLMGT